MVSDSSEGQVLVDMTLKSLSAKDPHSRYTALKALSSAGSAGVEDELLSTLVDICRKDKLGYNRREAMNVLRHYWPRPEVVESFRERLADEGYIAEACIELLGAIAHAEAHALLRQAFLDTPDVHTRLQVIQAFADADQPSIFAFLQATQAHESEDDRIRATVIALLGRVANPTLKNVFLKALKDSNARCRANAVEALTKITSGKELFRILATFSKDRNNRVRANAICGLLRLGVRQAEGLLHEMAHHQNPRYRSSAAWVLGEVGLKAPTLTPWLEKLSNDADNNVTYRAGMALKKIHGSSTFHRLPKVANG